MIEDEKNENEVTNEGAVEVREEDLDQASGGAVDVFLKQPIAGKDFIKGEHKLGDIKLSAPTDFTMKKF